MAEGWAGALAPGLIEPWSAGMVAKGLDRRAVAVMAEAGVDISGQTSKTLASLSGLEFDLVVTLCGNARETCPVFPGRTRVVHRGFDDPPALAAGAGSEDEALVHYRRVRDEIREFVAGLPGMLETGGGPELFI
jgi:arsenate reductase